MIVGRTEARSPSTHLTPDGRYREYDRRTVEEPAIPASSAKPGCAAIEKQDTEATEQLLCAAGFNIKPAETPEKLASLQAMTAQSRAPRIERPQLRFSTPMLQSAAVSTSSTSRPISSTRSWQYNRKPLRNGVASCGARAGGGLRVRDFSLSVSGGHPTP